MRPSSEHGPSDLLDSRFDSRNADPALVAALQLSLLEAAMRQEEEHEEHDGLGLHARRPSLERQSQTISEEGEGPRGQASASEQQPGRGGGRSSRNGGGGNAGSGASSLPPLHPAAADDDDDALLPTAAAAAAALPPAARMNRGSVRMPPPSQNDAAMAAAGLGLRPVSFSQEEAMLQEAIRLSLSTSHEHAGGAAGESAAKGP